MSEEIANEIFKDDRTDSLSLFTLLHDCGEFTAAIKALPDHLLTQTERELRRGFKPDRMNERLKIAFWEEYRRAQDAKKQMLLKNVFHGICNKNYFYDRVKNDAMFIAWMISPPPDELIVQKELLALGMKRLYEVLTLPLSEVSYKSFKGKIKKETKVNVGLIKQILSITEMLQDRVHGSIVQRQQIEAKTLSVKVDGGTAPQQAIPDNMADLDKMIKKLKQAEKLASKVKQEEPLTIEGEIDDGT